MMKTDCFIDYTQSIDVNQKSLLYRIKSNLCAYVAWICDDSKPKWSGGGCVCVHSIYNRPPPGVIIGPIIPDGSKTVGRSQNPGGQVVMWWAYLPLPPGWDIRVTWLVKIGGPIAPYHHLVPTDLGSDVSAHYYSGQSWRDVMSTFMEWIWMAAFFWIRRCSFSGTKEGSFALR